MQRSMTEATPLSPAPAQTRMRLSRTRCNSATLNQKTSAHLDSKSSAIFNASSGSLRGAVMKRILVGLFAIAVIGISAASAADMPTKAPPKQPVYQAVYNWTGFYVGAHVGYGWADPNIMPVGGGSVINHPMPAGALGGGQIGGNWQTDAG